MEKIHHFNFIGRWRMMIISASDLTDKVIIAHYILNPAQENNGR